MKKHLFFLCTFFCAVTFSQVQVGQSIIGDVKSIKEKNSESIVSLSANGNILAIAYPELNEFTGLVKVYKNISGNWTQIGNSIKGFEVKLGTAINLSADGNTLAIGNPDFGLGQVNNGLGRVVIFKNINNNWVQIGQNIDGEFIRSLFGISISLSADGNTVAIGARNEEGVNGPVSGRVRVYKNINNLWVQIGEDIDGEGQGDRSGVSVSLNADGSIIAIGAIGNNNGRSLGNSGHVRVYKNINNKWVQIGEDIEGDGIIIRWFGVSVSLNATGNIMAIGSGRTGGDKSNSGIVSIYKNINDTWVQIGQNIVGKEKFDLLGSLRYSVSLNADGTIVAIGANGNDGNGDDAGHVRIYRNINDIWVQIGKNIDGEAEGDRSGSSVSLSANGNIVAIGALGNENENVTPNVRVFKNISNTWVQYGQNIESIKESIGGQLGTNVSLSANGNIMAVSSISRFDNQNKSGLVRIYKKDNSNNWKQVGEDILGQQQDDFFGTSISLSKDGSTVAVGAYGNDGLAKNTGIVRVYKNNNNNWIQIGKGLEGQTEYENFGFSVSLNNNGKILVVGAPGYDNLDIINVGLMRIYKNINDTWVQIGKDIYGKRFQDNLGEFVTISSDGTVIATKVKSTETSIHSHSVNIYKNINDTWVQIKVNAAGGDIANPDKFGDSISLSADGSLVVIGAPENANIRNIFRGNLVDHKKGYIVILKNINNTYTSISDIIFGDFAYDNSGSSVSISADGNTVAVGATGNDDNGENSGHVRIYRNINSNWVKLGENINGEEIGDLLGTSVSLSADGNFLVVTAPGYDNNDEFNVGQVKFYELPSTILSSSNFLLSKFSMFPNPAQRQFTINLSEGLQLKKVYIFNQLGQLLHVATSSTIKTDNLPKGVYFVQIITNNGKATKKLVVE